MLNTNCYDWGVDNTHTLITRWVEPCENVSRTVKVSVNAVSAGALEESSFACSHLTADGTGLAGVLRLDENNRNVLFLRFVGQKHSELIEAPVAQESVELLPSAFVPYAFKVFHTNTASFGHFSDNLFCDSVVHIPHIKPLPSAEDFQMPLSGLCAFALERTSKSPHLAKNVGHSLIEASITGDCEVVYSKVDASIVDRTTRSSHGISLLGNNHVKPQAILIITDEFSTHSLPLNITQVVVGQTEGCFEPAFDGGYATGSFLEFNRVALVAGISNATMLFENRFIDGSFDCSANLSDTSNSQVGCEGAVLPNILVDQVMKPKTILLLMLPSNFGDGVSCSAELFESIIQNLFIRQPKSDCPIHNHLLQQTSIKTNKGGVSRNSPTD